MKAKVLVGFNFGYAHGFEGQEIEVSEEVFHDLEKKGFLEKSTETATKTAEMKKANK